jgi:3-hydroxy-D-aspartate aldolase
MMSRRQFIAASAATASALTAAGKARAAKTSPTGFPYTEFEARIAKRDFRDMTKDVLPTPCLVVDQALFEKNLKTMWDTTKANGIAIRPHVKVHKSVDVARIQLAHGGIGLTCATIAEAELMSNAGLKNVMWTKQPASRNNIERAVALSKKDPTFMFVVDDPIVFDWVEQAAAAENARVKVLASVYAGLDRQGIENGQPALELAQKIAASKHAQFEGIMAYAGISAHVKTFEKRRERSASDMAAPRETVALCKKAGLPVNIFTGGSTGTYNIDHENGLTELEVGSYVFMDTRYFVIGGKGNDTTYADFDGAMTVLTTVDSKRHPNLATTDYGNKAAVRTTDKVKGMPTVDVTIQGAEYGGLKWKDGDHDFKLGDRVEIYCTVLDDSTNYYDRYYVARGEQIVDVWPIMGRSGAAQR